MESLVPALFLGSSVAVSHAWHPQKNKTQSNSLDFAQLLHFYHSSLGGMNFISGKMPSDSLFSQNKAKN